MAAIVAFVASFIYLVGFLGVDFVHSLILRPSADVWATAEEEEDDDDERIILKEDSRKVPCGQALDCVAKPGFVNPSPSFEKFMPAEVVAEEVVKEKVIEAVKEFEFGTEDEEMVSSVISGKTPSYSLESKLGDCRRAAAIRREALQ
ncbi:hypothetical protein MLD38_023079 [Melastoma candidum]|uniref:Uncharacterized protein n=1 Tax=Melastoma candidum TaxID=119954 RepID=A0ACB9QMK3_9MYRT|nr:hypothetical protein MLD38_023079 [Melastoma candidum]